MNILGISAFYHDSAACLLRDGEIVAAAQEERFTRKKHDAAFPRNAVKFCTEAAGLTSASQFDAVAFYEKPFLKVDRLFSTYLSYAPRGLPSFLKAVPVWIKQKIWIKEIIRNELEFDGTILFPEHHESHAASAFFPSPFAEAAILTIDGVGEWTTTSIGRGSSNRVELLQEMQFPHSLGLLYSAFTQHLGFRVNSGEYKMMGLAPYGQPRFEDLILSELIDLKADGSFRMNLDYFDFPAGLRMTNRRFDSLFGGSARQPEGELTQEHMDIARSIQAVTEEVMLRMARHAHALSGSRNLCLAGGVALNCVANGRILREGPFGSIWIQPAAGDAGGALGAALVAWHHHFTNARQTPARGDAMKAAFLGPGYDAAAWLQQRGVPHRTLNDHDVGDHVAGLLEGGAVVGWYQGKAEFGPRALGNRSILADPRRRDMQEKLNLKIKFRESFRPFAPAVLRERVSDYFELDRDSPYMLLVAEVGAKVRLNDESAAARASFKEQLHTARSTIPAVTHVDCSARVQTVTAEDNPPLHALLRAFDRRTGCGVLVNTSFNVRGEPPVCTPEDAYRCFMRTDMDYLVLGNCLLDKREQPPVKRESHPPPSHWLTEEYEKLDRSPQALRRFGLTVGFVFAAIAALLIFNRSSFGSALAGGALLLIALALLNPAQLQKFHRVWMSASLAMGWFMTQLILTLVFCAIVVPIGLLQRAVGKRALDLRFRSSESSYWNARTAADHALDYEKQF